MWNPRKHPPETLVGCTGCSVWDPLEYWNWWGTDHQSIHFCSNLLVELWWSYLPWLKGACTKRAQVKLSTSWTNSSFAGWDPYIFSVTKIPPEKHTTPIDWRTKPIQSWKNISAIHLWRTTPFSKKPSESKQNIHVIPIQWLWGSDPERLGYPYSQQIFPMK